MKTIFTTVFFLLLLLPSGSNYAQWTQAALPNISVKCLAISPDSSTIYAGTGNSGIYSSNDIGGNWQRVDKGAITSSCNSINTEHSDTYVACTSTGIYISQDQGNTWTIPNTSGISDTHLNTFCWDDNGDALIGTNSGIFFASSGSGSFTAKNSGIPSNTIVNQILRTQSPQENDLWCATGSGAFQSNDHGTSWKQKLRTGKDINYIFFAGIFVVAGETGLYESTNQGNGWGGPFNAGTGLPSYNFTSLCLVNIDDSSNTALLIGATLVNNDTANFSIRKINSNPIGKVFFTTNWGAHLDDKSSRLSADSIYCMFYKSPYVIAGTNNGIWRRMTKEFTSVEDKNNNQPEHYSLEQNFPNPFNPTTTINYFVPKTSLVTIKVYDVLGKEIATLVNGRKSAGNYLVQFSSNSEFASGVYFYRMQAGSFVQTKKLLLLK